MDGMMENSRKLWNNCGTVIGTVMAKINLRLM